MASYSFIKKRLKKDTVYLYEPYTITEDLRGVSYLEFPNTVNSIMDGIKNVYFVNPPDGSMRARVIIASFDKAFSYAQTANTNIPEALLIVCCTPSKAQAEDFCSRSAAGINTLFTSLDIPSVSNTLFLTFQGEISFLSAFLRCESGSDPMQAIVDTLAERIKCNVYFTSSSGILLYENADKWSNNKLIENINLDSCLPSDLMAELSNTVHSQSQKNVPETKKSSKPLKYSVPTYHTTRRNSLNIYYAPVTKNQLMSFWLVLVSDSDLEYIGDIGFAFVKAASVIETRLEQNLKDGFFEPRSAFQRFMYDLKNENLQGGLKIQNRLSYLEYPPETYEHLHIRFAVIDFPDTKKPVPYSIILRQLRLLFPETNITAFDREIVLMFFEYPIKGENFKALTEPPCKNELTQLLNNYSGFMSFGKRVYYCANLKTHFLLTKEVNSIASALEGTNGNRLFVFQTFVNYLMIDWFSAGFLERFGYSGIIEFIHPAVLRLWSYDKKNDNNLSEVLYHYLINERSVKKTSEAVFMHRNTVAYKIKQIENIAGVDLESLEQCRMLTLSCQMLRYMLHDTKNTILSQPFYGIEFIHSDNDNTL